jgi:hypothetical protein
MGWCPECGQEYEPAVAACPRCRVVLSSDPPLRGEPGEPEVVHRVLDAASGALLAGMLEHYGIATVLRSAMLPGYGSIRRDWSTSAWGEILVRRADAEEARLLIADYLNALERGGTVRDKDVDEEQGGG